MFALGLADGISLGKNSFSSEMISNSTGVSMFKL